MIFYPKSYFNNILEIKPEFIKENNIQAIFLDIDNTLLDYQNNIIEGLEDWVENLKKQNIKFCILSNTNKKQKAERISKLLDIPYVFFAKKPLKFGFNKAKKILQIQDNKKIAVIGDQIMTDIFGANRCKMYSILVAPLNDKDILVTKINRVVEKQILKKYFEKNNIKKKS
ncbi:MAG: YqeG family HAD IIIA-type phosphatase [Clostridia bacterium]